MRSRRRGNFSVARFFLKLVWQNGKDEKGYGRKSGRMKKTNKRKRGGATVHGYNIPIGLGLTRRVYHDHLLSLSSSQIFTEPFSSLDSMFFLAARYDSYSFIGEVNLIESHLIRKMLDSQNNNANQVSSQFVTFV